MIVVDENGYVVCYFSLTLLLLSAACPIEARVQCFHWITVYSCAPQAYSTPDHSHHNHVPNITANIQWHSTCTTVHGNVDEGWTVLDA